MTRDEQRTIEETIRTMAETKTQLGLLIEEMKALRSVEKLARQLLDFDPTGDTYRNAQSDQPIREALRAALAKVPKNP